MLKLFKIKKGKRPIWEAWCLALMTKYYEEAKETLVEENLAQETCFLFGEGDESYALYKTISIKGKTIKPATTTGKHGALNLRHQAKRKECLEKVGTMPLLGYDIQV